MHTDDFDFELPSALIAQQPAEPRDAARLLHVAAGALHDKSVRDLPQLLRPGDILVMNDTRVIPTRLRGRRDDARVEITLHRRCSSTEWRAFARPARRLQAGDTVHVAEGLSLGVTEKHDGGEITVRIEAGTVNPIDALQTHGEMPLPPYIRRAVGRDARDLANYQTVYARNEGAVAAPTAGLHFTERLFHDLDERGIDRAFLTLHVGAGTFLPIKTQRIDDHRMHAEWGQVTPDAAARINGARARGGRVVAVGSTSLRLLESAVDARGAIQPFEGDTDIFIKPGHRFRTADLFLTNFHLPKSTLFVLVSAFAGSERIRSAYEHAIRERYRFYSYGDCCLLHRADTA